MRALIINPPAVCSYFNAGHRLPIFQVGAYLRSQSGISRVDCHDFGGLNATWKNVCDVLLRGYDVIGVFNDYDGIDGLERFVEYARRLLPRARLITFGRGSKQAPEFFQRFDLDAIAASGDYEACVADYVRYLAGGEPPAGVILAGGEGFLPASPGRFLGPEEWVLPDVGEIPYEAYDRLYAEDLDKFCGIPGRRELVVPVARGCPIGCAFCDVPAMQGRRERRLSVERTLAYIVEAYARGPFEYVSFYAPTFTLDKAWVLAFCAAKRAAGLGFPWKCVTTLAHLTGELIAAMGQAGCVRISVGLETLSERAHLALPRIKRESAETLREVAARCREAGIELNCFVILGLPGDTPEDAEYTLRTALECGARVRPTIYTPYQLMRPEMTPAEFRAFNRQLFVDGTVPAADADRYYRLFYANAEDRRTEVMHRIPTRGAAAARLTEAR